jgi:hypothetical protein
MIKTNRLEADTYTRENLIDTCSVARIGPDAEY